MQSFLFMLLLILSLYKTSTATGETKTCLQRKIDIERRSKANPGLQDGPISPTCAADGSYAPRQCNGFLNLCWCVNPDGSEITGSESLVDEGYKLQCCTQVYKDYLDFAAKNPDIADLEGPQCVDDGSWRPRQCIETHDICWCVKTNGEEIKGTVTLPNYGHNLECPRVLPNELYIPSFPKEWLNPLANQ